MEATRSEINNSHFRSHELSMAEVYKEIRKLNQCKSAHDTHIAIRVLKENANYFTD